MVVDTLVMRWMDKQWMNLADFLRANANSEKVELL